MLEAKRGRHWDRYDGDVNDGHGGVHGNVQAGPIWLVSSSSCPAVSSLLAPAVLEARRRRARASETGRNWSRRSYLVTGKGASRARDLPAHGNRPELSVSETSHRQVTEEARIARAWTHDCMSYSFSLHWSSVSS
jgi:hypothetical protein